MRSMESSGERIQILIISRRGGASTPDQPAKTKSLLSHTVRSFESNEKDDLIYHDCLETSQFQKGKATTLA
jgi:hypothetical protein